MRRYTLTRIGFVKKTETVVEMTNAQIMMVQSSFQSKNRKAVTANRNFNWFAL